MSDEIEIKLKNKKFSEISPGRKLIFFVCLTVMISTLVYTGFNLDNLHVREDTLNNYATGCKMYFRNGVFQSAECPNKEDLALLNMSGDLTKEYTLNDYYSSVNDNPFYNLTGWE